MSGELNISGAKPPHPTHSMSPGGTVCLKCAEPVTSNRITMVCCENLRREPPKASGFPNIPPPPVGKMGVGFPTPLEPSRPMRRFAYHPSHHMGPDGHCVVCGKTDPLTTTPCEGHRDRRSPFAQSYDAARTKTKKGFLASITTASWRRTLDWHGEKNWGYVDWSNALAGEVGEFCNLTKKIRRNLSGGNARLGMSEQEKSEELKRLQEEAREELCDIFMYLMLNLKYHGVSTQDFQDRVPKKFDKTSAKLGLKSFKEYLKS